MKQLIASVGRRIRDQVGRLGLDIRTVRGRQKWRAGIEVVWHPFDSRTERTVISHVDSFGEPVQFLVRDQKDYIQSQLLSGHFYAEDELRLIQRYYDGGTFVDIGANVGNHSLFAAAILKAPRVVAIEPFPAAFRILRCNIALNDMDEIIHHVPVALSDRESRGTITTHHEHNLGLAVLDEDGGSVPAIRGDSLLKDEDVSFIKLDVEGMEMQALAGLSETILRCRPRILIEVDDNNSDLFEHFIDKHSYSAEESLKTYFRNTYYMLIPLS